jgi:parallel beta-helix repeat protein
MRKSLLLKVLLPIFGTVIALGPVLVAPQASETAFAAQEPAESPPPPDHAASGILPIKPGYLTESHTSGHFTVWYTLDSANHPNDALDSKGQAERVAQNLNDAWDFFVDHGYRDPKSDSGHVNVHVYDVPYLGQTWSGWHVIEIDADFVRDDDLNETMATPGHELYHRVQYQYDASENDFMKEGSAKWVEDTLTTDLDNDPLSQYMARVSNLLGSPGDTLTSRSYDAALFWKYFSEQFGNTSREPDVGLDAARKVWEKADNDSNGWKPGPNNIDAFEDMLDDEGSSRDFEDVYADFAVANYGTSLDHDTVPATFRYIDDNDTHTPYPDVHKATSNDVSPGKKVEHKNQSLDKWSSRYHILRPASTCGRINVDLDGSHFLFWATRFSHNIVATKSDDWLEHWHKTDEDFKKSFVNQGYDEVAVIVSALANSGKYTLKADCEPIAVEIAYPTTAKVAHVGSPDRPKKLLARVQVTADGEFVPGLEKGDFEVKVGGLSGTVLSLGTVQGEYWLVLQPPDQSAEGVHSLEVKVDDVADSEDESVRYGKQGNADIVLVIDRSGSMSGNYIAAAKNAAVQFVDLVSDDDMIGVTSFNSSAMTNFALAPATPTNRTAAQAAINAISASGGTSIGAGLVDGRDQLTGGGDPAHVQAMVLLSDGFENATPNVDSVLPSVIDAGITVHTVSLGPNSDEALLQQIASETGGTYHQVGGALIAMSIEGGELADIYNAIANAILGAESVHQSSGQLDAYAAASETVGLDYSTTTASFRTGWAGTTSTISVTLESPSGALIPPGTSLPDVEYSEGAGYSVFRLSNPAPGDWAVHLVETSGVSTAYNLQVSAQTDLNALPLQGQSSVLQGQSYPILMSLAEEDIITGATVYAVIETPPVEPGDPWILGQLMADEPVPLVEPTAMEASNRIPPQVYTVTLFDDGLHDDGASDDGLYGAPFTATSRLGSYDVSLHASGASPGGGAFERFSQMSFYVESDADDDGDGLPNGWETLHGLNPANFIDAYRDPDLDGLLSFLEFMYGTSPTVSDTDGGGENDGSEVGLGMDPLSSTDDAVGEIRLVVADEQTDSVTLAMAGYQDYDHWMVYRSENPQTDFHLIEDNAVPGDYVDSGVVQDQTYYYLVQAVTADEHVTATSSRVSARPRGDTEAPLGGILIDDGAPTTWDVDVLLSLDASDDTTEMRLSNNPRFDGSNWEPFARTRSWTIEGIEGLNIVYVEFRDGAGNVSFVYVDGIEFSVSPLIQRALLPTVFRGASSAGQGAVQQIAPTSPLEEREHLAAATAEISPYTLTAPVTDGEAGSQTAALPLSGPPTNLCGSITTDTTLDDATSGYLVTCDVVVEAGVELTLMPGVFLRFENGTGLTVNGTLTAQGERGFPVIFVSASSPPQPGSWRGLRIMENGQATLNDVVVRHHQIAVYGYRSLISIADSLLLEGSQYSLYLDGAQAEAQRSWLAFQQQDAMQLINGTRLELQDSAVFHNGGYPIRLRSWDNDLVLSGTNSLEGSLYDLIALEGGYVNTDAHLPSAPVAFAVLNDVTVASGATLTLESGSVLKFGYHDGMIVYGQLIAEGSSSQPIIFTSEQETPSAGYWDGIQVGSSSYPAASATLNYTTIEYGGYNNANLYLYDASSTVTNSRIRYSSNHGIQVRGTSAPTIQGCDIVNNAYGLHFYSPTGNPSIHMNNIEGNSSYGAYNNSSNMIDLEDNWWGNSSGPYHSSNPGGSGETVSDYIDFEPWSTSPY